MSTQEEERAYKAALDWLEHWSDHLAEHGPSAVVDFATTLISIHNDLRGLLDTTPTLPPK